MEHPIWQIMTKRGLSARRVARETHWTVEYISRVKHGHMVPSAKFCHAMSLYFDLSVDQLFLLAAPSYEQGATLSVRKEVAV